MDKQRTEQWFKARLGKFTASTNHKLMGKKGLGKTGETYVFEKVAEELSGWFDDIQTLPMKWGTELEEDARQYYELAFEEEVIEQPFIHFGEHSGASPDGMLKGKKKGIEIKCPYNTANHVKYMTLQNQEELKAEFPQYYWQIMTCIMVTGAKAWDFVSYDPRFHGEFRMFVLEIKRNEADIELLQKRLAIAIELKKEIIERIKS